MTRSDNDVRASGRERDRMRGKLFAAKANGDTTFLIQSLRDTHLRPFAARFLADLGARHAARDIAVLLDANDAHARIAAARALGRLQATEAFPRILEMARTDPDPQARLWAIASLGYMKQPAAYDLLSSLLRNDDWDTRRAAAFALGQLGDRRAIPALQDARRSERLLRRRVYVRALRLLRER